MGESLIVRRGGGGESVVFDNIPANTANLEFFSETLTYFGTVRTIAVDNDFIYVGGDLADVNVKKFRKENLAISGVTPRMIDGGNIQSIAVDNDFIYASGDRGYRKINKYHKGNLAFVGNSDNYHQLTTIRSILALAVDNDFIYVGGDGNLLDGRDVKKYHKGNLVFVGNTDDYGGNIQSIAVDNDFIYAGGQTNRTVQKFHKGNLVFVGNTDNYGGDIQSIAVDNDFIYAGGFSNQRVQKFHKGNLAFVGNTNAYGGTILSIAVDNDFIYAGGGGNLIDGRDVKKWYKENLEFAGNTNVFTNHEIFSLAVDNDFIYAGPSILTPQGFFPSDVKVFYKNGIPEQPRISYEENDYFLMSFNNIPATPGNIFPIGNTNAFTFPNRLVLDNDFIYVVRGGFSPNRIIMRYFKENFVFDRQSPDVGFSTAAITVDESFVYVAQNSLKKYSKQFLSLSQATPNFSGVSINDLIAENGFVYAALSGSNSIGRYFASNLTISDNSSSYGASVNALAIDNDFIYAVGSGTNTTNRNVKKYHKGNLAFVGNSNTYEGGVNLSGIKIDNDFIYVSSVPGRILSRYHKGNLVFVDSPIIMGQLFDVDNGFLYTDESFSASQPRQIPNPSFIRQFDVNTFNITGYSDESSGRTISSAFRALVENDFLYLIDSSDSGIKKYQIGKPEVPQIRLNQITYKEK